MTASSAKKEGFGYSHVEAGHIIKGNGVQGSRGGQAAGKIDFVYLLGKELCSMVQAK